MKIYSELLGERLSKSVPDNLIPLVRQEARSRAERGSRAKHRDLSIAVMI